MVVILEHQNDNITKLFIKAHSEFKESEKSEKSIEGLYDILYLLKTRNRNSEEDYILARIYHLLGDKINSLKVIEEAQKKAKKKGNNKLTKLQNEIEKQKQWHYTKHYIDLRDAKLNKQPTTLNKQDFVVSTDDHENSYLLKLSNAEKNIVILNKNVQTGNDHFIFSNVKPDEYLFLLIEEHIKWLGEINEELLTFYRNTEFDHKLDKVGQDWFDGLNVWDLDIEIDKESSFLTTVFISDYLQNDFGFRLEIKNNSIENIEYDPIL